MVMEWNAFSGTNRERFLAAGAFLRQHPHSTLHLAPGIYEVTGDAEYRLYQSIISGEHGRNPQPFTLHPDFQYTRLLDLDGAEDVVIDADGATLLLNGFFEPISIRNCKNVTIRGLTIDYLRKPYSKGRITAFRRDGDMEQITVRFREDLPESCSCPRYALYDWNSGRLMPLPFRVDGFRKTAPYEFEYTVSGCSEAAVGCEFYVKHFFHSRPAILMQNACNIRLENVTIHTQPGMGITADHARDIDIEHLSVLPSAGDHLSTTTDATHFVSCYGTLRMHGCTFDGHGDDAVNVHTYYHTVTPMGGQRYVLHCMASDGTHTASPDVPAPGDELVAAQIGTLTEGRVYRVLESGALDWRTVCVTLDAPIMEPPAEIYLANRTASPDFTFSGCRVRNHFARSVLIKTRRAVVENCLFELSAKTPIVVSAEENWGEGISSECVTVRNNVFLNCAPTEAVSAVRVFTGASAPDGIQHGRILLENNVVIDQRTSVAQTNRQGFSVRNAREVVCNGNVTLPGFFTSD